MRPLIGSDTCLAHSEGAVARAKAAAKVSAEVRRASALARDEAAEELKIKAMLGVDGAIDRWAIEHHAEIAEALGIAALANPHGRAMGYLLERHLGRVPQVVDVKSGDFSPFEATEAELMTWLRGETAQD